MLSTLKLLNRKKSQAIKLISFFYYLTRKRKKLVVLDACTAFHLEHFKNVISSISHSNEFDVIVITPDFDATVSSKNISFYHNAGDMPLYRRADIYISTEFRDKPYWFDCPAVYFGHGIGPKLDYAGNRNLLKFDFVFSPCKPLYDIQADLLAKDKVFPVGLPILDEIKNREKEVIADFKLDKDKPILVYAPSWCAETSKISNIAQILFFLNKKTQFNIIVSPHPLLFTPEKCSGKALFKENMKTENFIINSPESNYTTLDLVNISSIVVSDISSILFEAMALNKKVIFDGNKDLYYYSEASHIFEELIKVCPAPDWYNLEDLSLENIMVNDKLLTKRKCYIDSYLFNNSHASKAFELGVNKILEQKVI